MPSPTLPTTCSVLKETGTLHLGLCPYRDSFTECHVGASYTTLPLLPVFWPVYTWYIAQKTTQFGQTYLVEAELFGNVIEILLVKCYTDMLSSVQYGSSYSTSVYYQMQHNFINKHLGKIHYSGIDWFSCFCQVGWVTSVCLSVSLWHTHKTRYLYKGMST